MTAKAAVPWLTRGLLGALLLVSGALPGAGQEEAGSGLGWRQGVVDDRGALLPTYDPRRRVVSLVPSLTETIVGFGAGTALVGRTRYDSDPRLAAVPSVGGSINPDLEAILGLDPDLVVLDADGARGLPERLAALGVATYAAESRSVADFRRHAGALGRLLGRAAAADSLVEWVERGLESARGLSEKDGPDIRPRVLFVLWPDPVLTTNGRTFVAEVIRAGGGEVAFPELAQPWPRVSLESVLHSDPDLVLLADGQAGDQGVQWILDDPRWKTLRAVREGQAHAVDADLFTRPGPGMVRAARKVARYLAAIGSPT